MSDCLGLRSVTAKCLSLIGWWVLITIHLMGLGSVVWAQVAPKVLILPFEIHSAENLRYLSGEVPRVLEEHLRQEGAKILDRHKVLKPQDIPERLDAAAAGRLARQAGADRVVWGSLTRIGDEFSLDAKLLNLRNQQPPAQLFASGRGIENLLGTVKELAQELSLKIFERQIIAEIKVSGNIRIESDAIEKKIKSKAGQLFSPKNLSDDLKAIYAMGYFEDIRVAAQDSPKGEIVTFTVVEKPTVRKITFTGNRVYDDDEIKENIDISTGSILNIFKINSNVKQIESFYKEKNYHNVKVSYKIHPLAHNQADLEFVVEEGQKIKIKSIRFEGNEAYSDDQLKKLMKTSEKGFFSWLTSSGELNREDLNQDTVKLAAFYQNHGYITARVGEPEVEIRDDWIYVTIKIEEGKQFKVGKVDINGELVLPRQELLDKLKIGRETYYNREIVRNDVLYLTDLYADEGYAYANVTPRIDEDLKNLVVNITYEINKGKQVYFEKIIISGNSKTRDKVIRRELKVYEKELFSGKNLKRGVRDLYRLDYFEDVKIDTVRGSSDDQMILKIDVTEKPTGSFDFGAGYSSIENLFAITSVTQRNLFGRGQTIKLEGQFGSETTKYTLSFTEPWLWDMPLSAGFDIYDTNKRYTTYEKDSIGGRVRFGYPVFDYTRAYLYYGYDVSDIHHVDEKDAPEDVKDFEGINVTSSVTSILRYDSRDRLFNPTEGSKHSISVEYAGLGGNIAFTKFLAETGWYFPLFSGTVGFAHGEIGNVYENSQGKLPDYEKFYLGGIDSIRGFRYRDINVPVIEDGREVETGGNKYVQFNFEYIVPIFKKAGVMGVIFLDVGNVYGSHEPIDLTDTREGAGFGFRWYSPIGPIRIENGYILDPQDGEKQRGRWEFTMGSAF